MDFNNWLIVRGRLYVEFFKLGTQGFIQIIIPFNMRRPLPTCFQGMALGMEPFFCACGAFAKC